MSDAALRAELERLQAATPRLARELATFPECSDARRGLERELELMRQELALLDRRLAEQRQAERRELEARDERTLASQRFRGRWWMSRLAPVAVVFGLLLGGKVIGWSLDHVNWTYWSERLGPWLVAVVPGVNAARLGLTRLHRRWRRSAR